MRVCARSLARPITRPDSLVLVLLLLLCRCLKNTQYHLLLLLLLLLLIIIINSVSLLVAPPAARRPVKGRYVHGVVRGPRYLAGTWQAPGRHLAGIKAPGGLSANSGALRSYSKALA